MQFWTILAISIVVIIVLLYRGKIIKKMSGRGFTSRLSKMTFERWIILFFLFFVTYLGYHFLHGRNSVSVTHYLVQNQSECLEKNAVRGETSSFSLRRRETKKLFVPEGFIRCYSPFSQLEFKTRRGRRIHIVSLK